MANELTYKDVLKNKEYKKLLFSNLINRFGDSVDAIAFTWLVYQITNSPSWTALIFGLNLLPNIIVQPFVGPIVERLNKKKVIIFTHVARGFVISAFVLMYLSGIVNPYILAAFTLTITTIESFNLPAAGAFIPSVVKKDKLAHAMSLNSSLSSAVSLVGVGLAGVIVARLGVQAAMIIDATTFFIAAIAIVPIKTLTVEGQTDEATENNIFQESYLSLLKDGFRYMLKKKTILNVCFVAVFMNFFIVPVNALQAPIAKEIFGLGSGLLSVMGTAGAIGGIIGAIITPSIMKRFSVKMIIVTGGAIVGCFMYIMSLGSMFKGNPIIGYLLAGICSCMMLLAATIISGTINIQFEKTCDHNYLARANSVLGAASIAAAPIGSFIVSAASIRLSTATLLGLFGLMMIVLMIFVFFSKANFEIEQGDVTYADQTCREHKKIS